MNLNTTNSIPYNMSTLKGKTYEEIHGIEKAIELKKKRSESISEYQPMRNPDSVKKLSMSRIGITCYRKGLTFEEAYGEERAKEIKKKLSDKTKEQLRTKGHPKFNYEFYLTNGYMKKYGNYNGDFNIERKKEIMKRDSLTCQICDTFHPKTFCCHHINYDTKDSHPKNLVFLCRSCHSRIHFRKEYWKKFLENLIGEKHVLQDSS